jgi:phospho-N-acetylmuramoyl-pentapeptide-transferase
LTGAALDLLTLALSFGIGSVLYGPFISALRRYRSRQVIQEELPSEHQTKAGTPTGGGMLFVALAIVGGGLSEVAGHRGALPALAGLLAGGVLGLADDRVKLRAGSIGIPARLKFPVQLLLAVPIAWLAHGSGRQALVPFELGLIYWPLAVLAITGAANAVNLTDGLDGLAGTLSLLAIVALVLLLPGAPPGEKAIALTLCGGLAAFLLFNRHPARVFMGDTGSLAIGYALAAMAIQQGFMLLLPLLGLVFVLETLSVIIQVAYFKASGGRRVFKMTPIHYTFQLEGWSENRIVLAFCGTALVAALLAAALARGAA